MRSGSINRLYIDTEYSSFYSADKAKSGELLQLAIVPVINGEIREAFNEYSRPLSNRWSPEAEKVHKISKVKALGFQHPQELAMKLLEYIKQYDCVFTCAGWNCRGDRAYIERLIHDYDLSKEWYRRVRYDWRDVLDRAKRRKKQLHCQNLKLETVAKYFQVPINAHDALSDAEVTRKVDDYLSTIKVLDKIVQLETRDLDNIQKHLKYTDRRYLQIGHGSVYISEEATRNPEAMRVIVEELWDLFVEGN